MHSFFGSSTVAANDGLFSSGSAFSWGNEWHPGIGGGVRLARRAAVVRMDYARSTETGSRRFYVTFGHMF